MQKKPPALPLPAGLEVQSLRPERWADVETLFGSRTVRGLRALRAGAGDAHLSWLASGRIVT